MTNRSDGITLADLDRALTLGAFGELNEGMGIVHLPTMSYHPIDFLVRHVYPRISVRQRVLIANAMKDYDPDREVVLVSDLGNPKIFQLDPHHIAARNYAKETYDQTNKDRI
jgi:hypothetical protein